MKRYLAFDAANNEYEEFDTIEEARAWLKDGFLDQSEGYHPDAESFAIYEIKERVKIIVTDRKENYMYENEEDIPEGSDEDAWPYDNAFDYVCKHEFIAADIDRLNAIEQ